jgi:hypothetical protein
VELPFPGDRCGFSPDGSFATFMGRLGRYELRVTDLDGAAIADFDLLYLQADLDHYSYGTDRKHLVRLDWNTLQLEILPSPAWCVSGGNDSTVWHDVHLIGSSGTAVVEQRCACTDCHISGVYVLQFSPGAAPQTVIAPTEWQILQISVFPDDSALIAKSWRTGAAKFEGGDRFLRVARDGSVTELGPFPDLPSPLHAPVTTPTWRDAR